jgi:ketosteroid isomerase-like protein
MERTTIGIANRRRVTEVSFNQWSFAGYLRWKSKDHPNVLNGFNREVKDNEVIAYTPAFGNMTPRKAVETQEIRKLDAAQADAVLRGDLAALDKLWSEDFTVTNPFNEIGKGDRIRSGSLTYSSFVRVPEFIQVHKNTVIVMGRETVVSKGNSPDAGKTINRRYTHIWMKREGKWRLVARHANTICQK